MCTHKSEQHWNSVAKTKSVTDVPRKFRTTYNETTTPYKNILPWVQEFKAGCSIKQETNCRLPSIPPVEVKAMKQAFFLLEPKKFSVKSKVKSSTFLDLWCMKFCTNT
jgi:hypothetical protein